MTFDSNASNNILESYMALMDNDSCLGYFDNILTVKPEVITEIQNTAKSR